MRKFSSMPMAVLVILMLILTACTDGGDESPGESTAATSQEPAASERGLVPRPKVRPSAAGTPWTRK